MTDSTPETTPEPAVVFGLYVTTEGVVTTNEAETENKEHGQ